MHIATLLKHQVTLPVDSATLFSWFGREGAFLRLTPPWRKIILISRDPGLEAGNRTHFTVKVGPFTSDWVSEHVDYELNEFFTDMQIKGPFSYWRHLHRFRALSDDSSIMEDTVRYIPPGGPIIHFFFRRMIKRQIKSLFRYRARILFNDFTCITKYQLPPKKILIAGGSGFIGTELSAFLKISNHEVFLLTRNPKDERDIHWNPAEQTLNPEDVEGFDIFINLSGENIGSKKWTSSRKKAIRESRIESTKLLADTINRLKNPPQTFVCASAFGYYGTDVSEPVDESGASGNSFLASVCKEWEEEAQKAQCRVVNTRFGLVLSPKGGALKQMLPAFKLGIGGTIGSGTQKVSWITIDDLIYQMYHVLCTDSIRGPVNFVTGDTITNEQFTKRLGRVLRRPTFCRVPKKIIQLLFGKMGEETLLASTSALPKKLLDTGATFAYPTIKKALEHLFPK